MPVVKSGLNEAFSCDELICRRKTINTKTMALAAHNSHHWRLSRSVAFHLSSAAAHASLNNEPVSPNRPGWIYGDNIGRCTQGLRYKLVMVITASNRRLLNIKPDSDELRQILFI